MLAFSFHNIVVLFFYRLSIILWFCFFTGCQLAALCICSGNFGNLNMNGECIVRLYFLCFGYDCILLSDCRDTWEGMLVCFKKILLVSYFCLSFSVFFSFLWISKRWSSSYSSLIRLPNCLPTLPKTAQTFCHHCQTLTNCLPAWLKTDQLFANQLTLRTSNKFLSPGQIYRNGWLSELLSYIWRVFHTHPFMVRFLSILPQIFWWRFLNASIITFITRKSDNSQMLKTVSLCSCGNF